MSVCVMNMSMPKCCLECMDSGLRTAIKCNEWTKISSLSRETRRSLFCPLVELPEHHGDLVDANEIRWDDHYDSDGNLSKYKIAYSDEMPDPVIKGEKLSNERSN